MSEHIIPADSSELSFSEVVSIEPEEVGPFYDLEAPDVHNYFDANGVNHQNSGKNMTMESNVAYANYSLLCLRSPQQYFWNITEPRYIDILSFSFVNEKQAKEIFFDSMKSVLRTCMDPDTDRNWFAGHGVDMRDNGIGDVKSKIITLPNGIRNRCIVASREGFEGSNILMGVFDEPSRAVYYPHRNDQAHTLLEKVQLNSRTRFGDLGKVAMFSYPEAGEGDLIIEAVQRAAAKEPGVWASKYPTYEVNPNRSYEDFEDFRKSNPERYETVIECNPPASRTGWYRSHPEKIDDTFRKDIEPVIQIDTFLAEREVTNADGETEIRKFTTVKLRRAIPDKAIRSLGGDPGKTGDSFALAFCRADKAENTLELVTVDEEPGEPAREPVTGNPMYSIGPDGERIPISVETRKVERRMDRRTINTTPIVDAILEIKPIVKRERGQKSVAYPIDFVSVKDLLLQIKQRFPNFRVAKFDHWNSASLVHELVRAGISAEDLAFTNAQQLRVYRQHRQLVFGDYIKHTANGPVDSKGRCKAATELHELQDFGHKVDHPASGSKDLSDAIVLAVDGMLGSKGRARPRVFI